MNCLLHLLFFYELTLFCYFITLKIVCSFEYLQKVARSLLTTIPGRTGRITMMGKVCEVKASEPKTADARPLANSAMNLPPPHMLGNPTSIDQSPQGWTKQHHRMTFGGVSGTSAHPFQQGQAFSPPPNFNFCPGGTEAGVPIYSHSTITRTMGGPILSASGDGTAPDFGTANVYIQNNFYTLPPGTELPTTSVSHQTMLPTPDNLQQQQQVDYFSSGGGGGTFAQFSYPGSAWEPSYPGPISGSENDTREHQQQQQQQSHSNRRPQNYGHYSSSGV